MNLRTTGIIIKREYLNKVKKKSFLLITFLSPILFAALCILPSLIMIGAKEEAKVISVVDKSGIVVPTLENSDVVTFIDCSGQEVEQIKSSLEDMGYDAVLSISELDENNAVSFDMFSKKPLGVDLSENIGNKVNAAVEAYRIKVSGIDNLEEIMKGVKSNARMKSYTLDDEGREAISESGVFMAVSMILGMIIYMFIVLFGGMVMSSVIEEKSSRVVEVLVSSVKSTELLFGKIIGIALVALTQFILWIVLTAGIVGVAGSVIGKDAFKDVDTAELVQMAGMNEESTEIVTAAVSDQGEMATILSSLKTMPWGQIAICFFIFFIFGYMLYASLFASIGSAVENEADSQQLQLPVTIPLLLGFFIAFYAFKAPESQLVFWGSMIPFTSPIVMLARLPYGVPLWQTGLSIVLLIGTFILCAWASAKIYKVGILMFGKKSTFKDLWNWLKMK